jgi:Icc-related predicted phosphoesterase
MRLLVITDIHSEFEQLSEVMAKVDFDFDVIVCPGDFSDMGLHLGGFDQTDIAQLALEELLSYKKPVLVVPGNHDPKVIIDVFEEYGVNMHGKAKTIKDVGFVGWGGAKTPFNTLFEPEEEETYDAITKAWKQIENVEKKVLFTHNPAKNTHLDRIASGAHVGSQAIRSIIEEKKPDVAISAHIHEARGMDVIGKTKMIYPGVVGEGWVGVVDIEKDVKMDIKNLLKVPEE